MADIGVKMGVSGIAQFKQSMNQAQQSVKTLDAALKLNEKQLQATGDKETYMQQKSKLLQQQIAAQNKVIKEGQQALSTMEKQGVNPASQAYQKMQQQVLNAQTALLDMHGDLESVGQTAEETASKTDKLTDSLNGINKKVSFDAVLNGIGKITDGMEAAARKVAALARDVWDTMATAAAWADNENALAAMYGIDVETLQKMQGASRTIDTSVEAIIKSRQKLKQNMASDSKEIAEAFTQLGVSVGYMAGKQGEIRVFRDWEDVFWDVGAALLNYNDEVQRDVIAQQLFGRSWMELMPLFQAGRDEYQKTMDEQSIVTQQNVDKLNALDDALQRLDQDYQATKNTILAELAPAFTKVADGLSNLIEQVNEYLQTDEGKEKLEALGQAVTDLFTGITDVDFSSAIKTAGDILDSVTGALGWIKDNHEAVETALKGIGGAFLALKAAEVVGTLVQSAAALKTLLGGGGTTGAGAAASSATTAAGAAAVTKVTTGSKLLDALGIGALFKTAKEASEQLGTGIWGYWHKKQQMQEMSIAGVVDPDTGIVYSVEEWEAMQAGTQQPSSGPPKRVRNITGTASEDSMKGADQLREERIQAIYDELYHQINDYDPREPGAATLDDFWRNVVNPLVTESAGLQGVVGDEAKGIVDLIYQKIQDQLFDETWEGSTGGILNIMQEAIDEAVAGQKLKAPGVEPELSSDAQSVLQGQLNGMGLTVPVVPDLSSIDGSHANGLPFVPFDGYIAALHKGERVVPANQNKNYSATSNLYVESMYMNNGTDVQGLAAAMAAENRRVRAGVGS